MSEVDVADGTVPSPQNFRTALVPCRELLTTRPRSKGKLVRVRVAVVVAFMLHLLKSRSADLRDLALLLVLVGFFSIDVRVVLTLSPAPGVGLEIGGQH